MRMKLLFEWALSGSFDTLATHMLLGKPLSKRSDPQGCYRIHLFCEI